jgi:hypothetical protein
MRTVSKTFESQTKKNPYIKKHFLLIWSNEFNISFDEMDVLNILKKMKKFNILLKNNKFDVNAYDSFEIIDDTIEDLIKESKVNQLKKSLLSNKYRVLVNNETNRILSEIIDAGIKRETVLPYINKIAGFKTSKELNEVLLTCVNDKVSSGIKNTLNIIKKNKLNVDITLKDVENNVLIVKVNDFKASKILGSTNWCISRTEHYFKQYTESIQNRGKGRKPACQFFVFDFNKEPSHPYSMIGVTVNDRKLIFAADKFDHMILRHPLILKTVELNEQYWTHDEYLKYLMDRTMGNDFKSLDYVRKTVKTLKTNKVKPETLIQFSHFLDKKYTSKALKRLSKKILADVLMEYKKFNDGLPSELKELIEQKMPQLKNKMK